MKSKFVSGGSWTTVGLAVDNFIQFAVFAMLVRILSQADVGLVALAVVMIDLGRVVVYGGLPEAMVRMPTWDQRVASACFSANLAAAILFAIGLSGVVGPLLERFYSPGSWAVLSALSIVLIIDSARAIHVAKLRREFRYRSLAFRGAIGNSIAGVVAVACAYLGAGVWSLVIQRLGVAVILTFSTWKTSGFLPQIIFSRLILNDVAGFGVRATIVRILDVSNARVTDVILAFWLGPAAVAIYRVGGRSLDAITLILLRPFQDAAFSAFSRVADPALIGRALLRIMRVSAAIICPVYLGAAAVATDLTVIIFGDKYAESGLVMMVLAIGALPMAFGLFITSAFLTAADGRIALKVNLVTMIVNTVLSFIGGFFSPLWGAAGNSVAQIATTPYRLSYVKRNLNVTGKEVFVAVRVPLLAASIMACAVFVTGHNLPSTLNSFVRLCIEIPVGVVAYIFLLMLGRDYTVDLIREAKGLLPARLTRRKGSDR